jgi:L-ascorbate metabolism protein UlaG (beta-lactamase superfamily)
MELQRLSWASLVVKSEGKSLLIDPLGGPIRGQERPLAARLGEPKENIIPLESIEAPNAVLVTHVHPDHFDHKGILHTFGDQIPVYVPKDSTGFVTKLGFKNVIGVETNEEFTIGHIRFTAAHSVDGFGTPQVSWVVNDGFHTIIHSGDTQWHGYWWQMEQKFGPIHAACLPVNGPILDVAGLRIQSSLPACLTPEQAIEAARILGAEYLVPIHYGTFNNPPYYSETENIEARLLKLGMERGVRLKFLQESEQFTFLNSAFIAKQ